MSPLVSSRRWPQAPLWLALLCASPSLVPLAAAQSVSHAPKRTCASLEQLAAPGFRISALRAHEADAKYPSHCELTAAIDERTGTDGRRYAIGMRLRLPAIWNGRFVFQGLGGTDGTLGDGDAQPGGGQPSALNQGYATVTTDAGHMNQPGALGSALFGLDPQARVDFGYRATDVVTVASKRIVAAYYGNDPQYSYFIGCSNGGRHGMVASQRFPQHFDGIAAGAPGFRMPEKGLSGAAATQGFAAIAPKAEDNRPILSMALSPDDMKLVANGVLQACDALDGLVDGIIDNARACRFSARALQCSGEKTASCLSAAQVGSLENYFSGPTTAQGHRIYAPYPYDAGVGTDGWRRWILGTAQDSKVNAFNVSFGASLAFLYMTPPHPLADDAMAVYDFYRTIDVTQAHERIFGTSAANPESSVQVISANSVDLTAFKARKGKLLLYHGLSDPTFSALDTVNWYERFDRQEQGHAADHARLFLVPGMNHCSGGPSTDSFDVLAPLVAWVEQGRPPERITARANAASPWPQRTRPLCPYPRQARYNGSGSIEEAANFSCR